MKDGDRLERERKRLEDRLHRERQKVVHTLLVWLLGLFLVACTLTACLQSSPYVKRCFPTSRKALFARDYKVVDA